MNGAAIPDEEPKFLQVNAKVGFSTKQVLAGLGMLGTGIVSLIAAGWIALPAKQQDLTRVEQSVASLQVTVGTLATHTKGLAEAVVGLQGAINELQAIKSQSIQRPLPRPKPRAVPKPQPQPGIFGSF